MKFSKPFYKELASVFAIAYILVLFCIYPFYMKEGYVDISLYKFYFYMYVSLGEAIILSLFFLINVFSSKSLEIKPNKIVTASLIYLAFTVVSFIFAPNKEDSFFGEKGWNMGFVTLSLMCVLVLLISLCMDFEYYIVYGIIASSVLINLLCIFDRFSFYIIPLEIRDPSFVSTLGNINWFTGYLCIAMPISAFFCLHAMESQKPTWIKILLTISTLISFMAGFAQGSDSVLLLYAAMFAGLFFLCGKKCLRLDSFFFLLGLCSLSSQIIYLIRLIIPEKYNYETKGVCSILSGNAMLSIVFLISVVLFLLFRLKKLEMYEKHIYRAGWILALSAVIFVLIIGLLKTNTSLITGFNNSLFYFDTRFGQGRGQAYRTAVLCFREMNWWQKLIGVGPDGFSSYAYSIPYIKNELIMHWPTDKLTNAHSSILTLLVNQGILGMSSYYYLMIRTIKECLAKRKEPVMLAIALCTFSFCIHNLISFDQVLNTTFEFALIAIAASFEKAER